MSVADQISRTPDGTEQTRQPVLEIRNLSVAYRADAGDVQAVRNVNLSLKPGEILGLAGESGCGKSTLAYGAVRLLRPPAVITGGDVIYRGRRAPEGGVDVLAASQAQLRALRWREISIVFQSAMNSLNPVLRIRSQIADVLNVHTRLRGRAVDERVNTLLEMVGISAKRAGAYPHELSGGMRQRVMIAMALAVDPEVVIMDEPTTGLDVIVQREIVGEIMRLREQLGFAMLFITHDLSLLLEVCDEVAVMYAGEVIERAPISQVRKGGAHPYTRGLLGSFPSLHGPRVQLSGISGSPPDLRGDLRGCQFRERCAFAHEACATLDVRLEPVPGAVDDHLTACPFVIGGVTQTPDVPQRMVAAARQLRPLPSSEATVGEDPDAQNDRVLCAKGLCKSYPVGGFRDRTAVAAVKDVDLELCRGRVVGLVGASGSGKSTIAKLLSGQERRTRGAITLDGKEIDPASRSGFRAYKSEVQMVFQDPFASLNPLHTVGYHITRALAVHAPRTGVAPSDAAVDSLLARVRLSPAGKYRTAYPHELSGGQRQRVSIARALAAQPRVLLADEPVSMLDVSIRLEILDLIAELRDEFRLAILYITHDIASARYFADEILVMHQGVIVERGPAEDVVQNPQDDYTRLLISSSPDPDTFKEAPEPEELR